ncbi:unnamed protein product [Ectocarpus sp. 6 AP-2014]
MRRSCSECGRKKKSCDGDLVGKTQSQQHQEYKAVLESRVRGSPEHRSGLPTFFYG